MKARQNFKTSVGVLTPCLTAALLAVSTPAQAQVHVQNTVGTAAVTPQQQQVEEVGPVLDVVPCVLSDGFTINLTLIPITDRV